MQIETSRFGALEVNDTGLIHFLWGIPGFEELKRYVLLEYREGPFQWLHAVDEPTVAFVVCPPELLGIEYRIPPVRKDPLKLEREEDLFILNLVSFARDRNVIRFHTHSPLLFNTASRTAYQWTMDSEEVRKYVTIPDGLTWTNETENPF